MNKNQLEQDNEMLDKMLRDILAHGQSVTDANGKLVRAHPSATMIGKIMEWLEKRAAARRPGEGNGDGAILEQLKANGMKIEGKVPPLPEGDDAASR